MVFNRLCAPDTKLGCLRWLDSVAMPAMPEAVTHQHPARAMDALMDRADQVERERARQIRPLVDRDLSVVFHDLTAVRIRGEGTVEDDLRAYGMNKARGGIARRFVLGVVQTADGLPSTVLFEPVAQQCRLHTVHPGNVAETKTLQAMLATVPERFPIQRARRRHRRANRWRDDGDRHDARPRRGSPRVLKSDIEIAPVHHHLPDRIRAHAPIRSLVHWRVMRMRLKARGHAASPRTALDLLARIRKHTDHAGTRSFQRLSKPPGAT